MRNYVKELRAMGPDYTELADYMNERLIKTNKTIFEYIPLIDGLKEGKQHLYPLLTELIEKGFFDGN